MKHKRFLAMLLTLVMVFGLLPTISFADESGATLTFTDSGITETVAGTGYSISGTTLSITAAGTYTVTGSCAEGCIVVKKGVTGVTLILKDLSLSCSTTAPLACNKTTGVTLDIEGTVTLTDKEDPANETSADATVADAFEGAAIKVKSGASLTITGSGTLTADGSACKNGIKGGATATVTVSMDGKLIVKAANNGLASDGEVIVKKGTLDITAVNEGIKSEPDTDDAESKGAVTIYGGTLTINAQSDGMQATNDVTIYGGTFTINAANDGIQSNGNLTITNGSFNITTFGGYNASGFNEDTMSAKGVKASTSDEDTENATNLMTISGGTFVLNTRDDAVHCDGTIEITGGTFNIKSGDDGVHADTRLTLGTEGGLARDPDITISNSYEGLESANLYILSGRYYVAASDDGINAAGGTGNTDHFNPGGGWGGGPGGGWNPGGGGNTGDYSLNISGGSVYVICDGDGLDSNGALNLTGGTIEVWAQYNRDNEPLDSDGTIYVKGATVFAAGSAGMGQARPGTGSQTYKNYSVSISANKLVQVKNGSTVVYNTTSPKQANYVFFSSPSMTTSYTVSAASGSVSCKTGNSWSHTWNSGVVTTAATTEASGLLTYTCTVCGATETQTIPQLTAAPEEEPGEEPGDDPVEPDNGFTVTFTTDAGSKLTVYKTQDVTGDSILSVGLNASGADVSRNSTTGEPDSTGDGQVNFVVTVTEGYELVAVSATEGTYKNIKLISSEGSSYVYRVTKITADTTVSVQTKSISSDNPGEDTQQENPFVDVKEGDWFETAVLWAVEQSITNGTDETHFSPTKTCTRAEVVQFLWNAAGKPAVNDVENPFKDVSTDDWFYSAVLWAVNEKITNGTDATHFSPTKTCTRAEVVQFLYKAK